MTRNLFNPELEALKVTTAKNEVEVYLDKIINPMMKNYQKVSHDERMKNFTKNRLRDGYISWDLASELFELYALSQKAVIK